MHAGLASLVTGFGPDIGMPPEKETELEALLTAYLPIIIFIGICLFIGIALHGDAVHRRLQVARSRESCRPMNAASTPSTTRA